ncbi:MAG: isoprenylcysteine carboxylmethyltransferase family protein [Pseudomonadota bacterium]
MEPSPKSRQALALAYGLACHGIFALAGLVMTLSLYTGLQYSLGAVPWPWAALANLVLLAQFPLAHSLLLTGPGRRLLSRFAPAPHGKSLSTTVYAMIASVQLILLFTLWTASGLVVWQATGWLFFAMTGLFGLSWLLLAKASYDAGPELQSGAMGWMALFQGKDPKFPDMPTTGLFKIIRQPIYVAFAMTLWTMPVWTADQLTIAVTYTAYCYFAPRLKERRFVSIYGDRFRAYQQAVPYWFPTFKRPGRKHAHDANDQERPHDLRHSRRPMVER